MGREICPLFDRDHGENITLVGAWMLHPVNLSIVPDPANFLELGHMGPMAASYFKNEPHRLIPNHETDLGRGCKFIGGAFVMGADHPAPNEAGGRPGNAFEYVMKNNGGITICVRERKHEDPRPSPKGGKRKWWQLWR